MSKHRLLLMLVLANILPAALILFLATCFDYVQFNPLFNPGYFASAGILSAQVLILAIFTAFHDPRWPPLRWLSIAAVLFVSLSLFAVEMGCTHYLWQRRWGYIPAGSDRLLQLLYFSMVATSAVLAGCMAWILLLHIAAWPLRALLGLRIIRKGEPDASLASRQFGITHLMAWVGLFAALLWLLKTATSAQETMYPLLAILGIITASMLLVLPWTCLLVKEKIKLWPVLVAFLGVAALSYVADQATFQFNMFQIRGRSAASSFLLPSFQILEFGSYGGLAMLTAVLNFFALRKMGFRFQRAKAIASTSHFTTIAPQPPNVAP